MKKASKTCKECEETKPIEEFHKNGSSPDGLHSRCKSCKNIKSRNYYEAKKQGRHKVRSNPMSYRENHLRKTYGITCEQYNDLLEKQSHCCALCGKHESEFTKKLAVDHDHFTGEIRGLLCGYCNHRVVGRHRNGDLLRKVADYIEQGTGWFVPKKKRPKKRKVNW